MANSEYTKHLYNGEDLAEIEKAFQEVANKYPLVKKGIYAYKLQEELVALNTECKLVNLMYKLNDFRASCYAYSFTMRKIEEIMTYCYNNFHKKEIREWCDANSDFAKVQQRDGSTMQYSNLGYIFEYLQENQMAIAGRWFIEYNIQYLEKDKQSKDFPSRRRILASAMWWVNQGLLGRFGLKMPFVNTKLYDFTPQVVIFSTFPSSGKSYLVNTTNEMFAELNFIINKMGGFLRVGNEQGNIFRQSSQTMGLIKNKNIMNIYPENKQFIFNGSYRPFAKSSEEEWGLNGVVFDPATSIFKTRDSAINSVRCMIASMDDPSRGQQESTNVKIHNDIYQLYKGDFSDRFKSQDDKFIILTGTMFNPNDVFAREIEDAMDGAVPDKRFTGTYINKAKKTVVIMNDCENEQGGSAFPEFISDQALAEKRKGLDAYDYACVWRQKPIPAEGLMFDYEYLKTYDTLPVDELHKYSVAYIDPTRRKAQDFFAMPIARYNNENDEYYLVDAIFEQKSTLDLYDTIIEKIITHTIVELVLEENIDASLITVLNDRLKYRGVNWCKITTSYSRINKNMRIAQNAGTIKNGIRFPKKGSINPRSQLAQFMKQFTEYTADGKQHDDAPDAISGLADAFIIGKKRVNKVKTSKKLPF